jgi:hypothetical protein
LILCCCPPRSLQLNFPGTGEQSGAHTSKYHGVSWHIRKEIWQAQLTKDKKRVTLSSWHDEEDAARRVDRQLRWSRLEFPHHGASGRKKQRLNFPTAAEVQEAEERRDTADCQRGLFRIVIQVKGKLGVKFKQTGRWVVTEVKEQDGRGLLAEATSPTGLKVRKGDTLVSINGCATDSMPDDMAKILFGERNRELGWLRREKKMSKGRGERMLAAEAGLRHEAEAEVPRQRRRWREEAERKEKKRKLQAERSREKRRQKPVQMGGASLLDGTPLEQGGSGTVDSRMESAVQLEPDDISPFLLVPWSAKLRRRQYTEHSGLNG